MLHHLDVLRLGHPVASSILCRPSTRASKSPKVVAELGLGRALLVVLVSCFCWTGLLRGSGTLLSVFLTVLVIVVHFSQDTPQARRPLRPPPSGSPTAG
jgi:hypothetical protein